MKDRRRHGEDLEGALVRPGEIVVADDGSKLVAVVASGVAVCLWAASAQVAALAHFVEPRTVDPDRAFARFGNVAVPEVVRLVRNRQPDGPLEAQLFGGASRGRSEARRAGENLRVAESILEARGIDIVSRDVGGSLGRKIVLDGRTGHTVSMKVRRLREEDWAA